MKKILLDTNAYSRFLLGDKRLLEVLGNAEIFGFIKHELKKKGTPIPINDVWIASHTFECGATLITFDNHFLTVPGLRVWDEIS